MRAGDRIRDLEMKLGITDNTAPSIPGLVEDSTGIKIIGGHDQVFHRTASRNGLAMGETGG